MTAIAFTAIGLLVLAGLAMSSEWLSYITVRRFTLDANHAWVSLVAFALAAGAAMLEINSSRGWVRVQRILTIVIWSGLALSALSGTIMFLKLNAAPNLTRLGYAGFEIGLALALLAAAVRMVLRAIAALSKDSPSSRSSRGGED